MLSGRWTYRCYRNDPALAGGDAAAAFALILDEGVFDLEAGDSNRFHGGIGAANGNAMSVEGSARGGAEDFAFTARGIDGTPTQGWRHEYRGRRSYRWPEATEQVESLVGTVLRVSGGDSGFPAGATASFVAVRGQPAPPPARAFRRNTLLAGM
ncbi:MAG TPA: hypothetical protein VGB70_05010 [Allosphingosinicella sp.]|jgi:hypothetical protein